LAILASWRDLSSGVPIIHQPEATAGTHGHNANLGCVREVSEPLRRTSGCLDAARSGERQSTPVEDHGVQQPESQGVPPGSAYCDSARFKQSAVRVAIHGAARIRFAGGVGQPPRTGTFGTVAETACDTAGCRQHDVGFLGRRQLDLPQSSLYTRDWTPLPAARAYQDLVLHKWGTRWTGITDREGRAEARVFYGKHKVMPPTTPLSKDLRQGPSPGHAWPLGERAPDRGRTRQSRRRCRDRATCFAYGQRAAIIGPDETCSYSSRLVGAAVDGRVGRRAKLRLRCRAAGDAGAPRVFALPCGGSPAGGIALLRDSRRQSQ